MVRFATLVAYGRAPAVGSASLATFVSKQHLVASLLVWLQVLAALWAFRSYPSRGSVEAKCGEWWKEGERGRRRDGKTKRLVENGLWRDWRGFDYKNIIVRPKVPFKQPTASFRRLQIPHLHISIFFKFSHLHIFTSPHFHISTSPHQHINTSAHQHISTSPHPHIFKSTRSCSV